MANVLFLPQRPNLASDGTVKLAVRVPALTATIKPALRKTCNSHFTQRRFGASSDWSADFESAGSWVSNPPGPRTSRTFGFADGSWRLEVGDTAGWKPALQELGNAWV
jgi:hypothetical protein